MISDLRFVIQFLWGGFMAYPGPVLSAVGKWVLVPAVLLAAALWALVALVSRYPGAALPEPKSEPVEVEPSLAVEILAGRVPVDETVPIRRSR